MYLNIYIPNPIAFLYESFDQVAANTAPVLQTNAVCILLKPYIFDNSSLNNSCSRYHS